jgi:hypothetical protein
MYYFSASLLSSPCCYIALYHTLLFNNILYIRIAIFTAVTMKNVVFWDIKSQLVPR